ncbi:hypothetical protein RB195_005018 [Necator americanus]
MKVVLTFTWLILYCVQPKTVKRYGDPVVRRKPRMQEPLTRNHTSDSTNEGEIDRNLTTFSDLARKYTAARNLLKKFLANSSDAYIDNIIENEAKTLGGTAQPDDDKERKSVTLDGRRSINTPCFSKHMLYVQESEQKGCQGAVRFASRVCSEFLDCMARVETSYWICKPKICNRFRKMPEHDYCLDFLFKCN